MYVFKNCPPIRFITFSKPNLTQRKYLSLTNLIGNTNPFSLLLTRLLIGNGTEDEEGKHLPGAGIAEVVGQTCQTRQ